MRFVPRFAGPLLGLLALYLGLSALGFPAYAYWSRQRA